VSKANEVEESAFIKIRDANNVEVDFSTSDGSAPFSAQNDNLFALSALLYPNYFLIIGHFLKKMTIISQ